MPPNAESADQPSAGVDADGRSKFMRLLQSGTPDVTVVVGGEPESKPFLFRCHRSFITVHSSPFKALVENIAHGGELRLRSAKPATFGRFLHFCYTREVPRCEELTGLAYMELGAFAHDFAHERLRAYCETMLRTRLTINNVCELIRVHQTITDPRHGAVLLQFVARNAHAVTKSKEWGSTVFPVAGRIGAALRKLGNAHLYAELVGAAPAEEIHDLRAPHSLRSAGSGEVDRGCAAADPGTGSDPVYNPSAVSRDSCHDGLPQLTMHHHAPTPHSPPASASERTGHEGGVQPATRPASAHRPQLAASPTACSTQGPDALASKSSKRAGSLIASSPNKKQAAANATHLPSHCATPFSSWGRSVSTSVLVHQPRLLAPHSVLAEPTADVLPSAPLKSPIRLLK